MKEGRKTLLATKPHLAGDVPQMLRLMATPARKLQWPGSETHGVGQGTSLSQNQWGYLERLREMVGGSLPQVREAGE